jgi:phosphatidylinositol-3-phosphatase
MRKTQPLWQDLNCITIILVLITGFGCKVNETSTTGASADSTNLAKPDHLIFVWMENRGFETIIGNPEASYINYLAKKGTLFTNSFALTHPSYPNYIQFFAGDALGVKDNSCIEGAPFDSPNLYTVLKEKNRTFAWYSEDLPAAGSKVCVSGNYVQKHNPVPIFANVPLEANKRFADFPSDYSKLEDVVCITPNLINDMHDGTIKDGDEWLRIYLNPLIEWCSKNNSIFVLYWDESEVDNDNRIPVIAVGEKVKAKYRLPTYYDHYSWSKTISQMFDAATDWTKNVSSAKLITGCWKQ